jgi:hypothetical protein
LNLTKRKWRYPDDENPGGLLPKDGSSSGILPIPGIFTPSRRSFAPHTPDGLFTSKQADCSHTPRVIFGALAAALAG